MKINYAIVFVSDMTQSVSFYRDVIGLPLKFESPHWTEFATDGATLALHLSDIPKSELADSEDLPAGRCRTGFSVPNLEKFHQKMADHNVPCIQEPQEIFGAKIAQYLDPDGMSFSVGEEGSNG